MRLVDGGITINKPVDRVYSFLTQFENLEKQFSSKRAEEYELEFDDDISGPFEIGERITVYLFSLYEGDEDKCFDLEVTELEENKKLSLKLASFGKYSEEADDWLDSDSSVMEKLFGVISFEMIFTSQGDSTVITFATTCTPQFKVIAFFAWLINLIGRWKYKKDLKEWARLVALHA